MDKSVPHICGAKQPANQMQRRHATTQPQLHSWDVGCQLDVKRRQEVVVIIEVQELWSLEWRMETWKCVKVCDVAAKMAPGDIIDTRWSGVEDENWWVLSMGVTDLRLDARYRLPTQFVHLIWNQLAVCTCLHELQSVSLLTLLNHLHITWHAANNQHPMKTGSPTLWEVKRVFFFSVRLTQNCWR